MEEDKSESEGLRTEFELEKAKKAEQDHCGYNETDRAVLSNIRLVDIVPTYLPCMNFKPCTLYFS